MRTAPTLVQLSGSDRESLCQIEAVVVCTAIDLLLYLQIFFCPRRVTTHFYVVLTVVSQGTALLAPDHRVTVEISEEISQFRQ